MAGRMQRGFHHGLLAVRAKRAIVRATNRLKESAYLPGLTGFYETERAL